MYSSLFFHFCLKIPENYPLSPPRLLLQKGQDFNSGFKHEHVYGNKYSGYRLCVDILDDFSGWFEWVDRGKEEKHTGWSNAYDLLAIVMQVQIFLSEPDLPKSWLPTKKEIAF